jgi:hypothetical protein
MRRLVLSRVEPNTLTTGFSGIMPASVSDPVRGVVQIRKVKRLAADY